MTAYRRKLHAFEKSIRVIEKSAMNNSFVVSDASFQALYNTYEEMKKQLLASDEAKINDLAL